MTAVPGTFSTSELVASIATAVLLLIIAVSCCVMLGTALQQTLEYRRKWTARKRVGLGLCSAHTGGVHPREKSCVNWLEVIPTEPERVARK